MGRVFKSSEKVLTYLLFIVFMIVYVNFSTTYIKEDQGVQLNSGVLNGSYIGDKALSCINGGWQEIDVSSVYHYRAAFKIEISKYNKPFALYINGKEKGFDVFVIDKIGSNNIKDYEYALANSGEYHQYIPFSTINSPAEIVVVFSQNTNFRALLNHYIKIGTQKVVYNRFVTDRFMEMSFFGGILLFALFFLLYFVVSPGDYKMMVFSLLNFAVALRILFTSNFTILPIIDDLSPIIVARISNILIVCIAALFVLFAELSYRGIAKSYMNKILGSAFFIALISSFFESESYSYVSEIFILLGSMYAFYVVMVAVSEKRPGAVVTLDGLIVLIAAGVNESLDFHYVIDMRMVTPFCLVTFILFHAIYYAIKDKDEIEKAEKMTKTMKIINEKYMKFNEASSKFVPVEFLHYLKKKTISDIKLGDFQEFNMTVLFIDIREFTKLSEAMTPQENFAFLNSYLKVISPCISLKGGFIDKYIGDAVMALFPNSPADAIDAAIAVKDALIEYNIGRAKAGYMPIKTGAGIHSGKVILGTIGNESRMETTVISDAVNVSSRLEHSTKFYGESILISDDVFNTLPDQDKYLIREIDYVKLRGKANRTTIYSVLNGDDRFDSLYLDEYKKALQEFHANNFPSSLSSFKKLSEKNGFDKVARIYYDRSRYADISGAPDDWGGFYDII